MTTKLLIWLIALAGITPSHAQWQTANCAPIERTPETEAWFKSMSGTNWQISDVGPLHLHVGGVASAQQAFVGPEGKPVQITHWTVARCQGSNHLLLAAKDVPGWRYLVRLNSPTQSADGTSRPLGANEGTGEPISGINKPKTGIFLEPGWASPFQGGENTIEDLRKILPGLAMPSDANPSLPDLEIYKGITYLMPLKEAIEKLDLKGIKSQTKQLVVCPGLPKNSLFSISYDGTFEEHYNRLFLVVDKTNRVVCVQLVDESPQALDGRYQFSDDQKTFNFICTRRKGASVVEVGWRIERVPSKTHVVSTALVRKEKRGYDRDGKEIGPKPLELTKWYLPDPFAALALACIEKFGAGQVNDLVGTTWRSPESGDDSITFTGHNTLNYTNSTHRYAMTSERKFRIFWSSKFDDYEISPSGDFFTGVGKKWVRVR